jgi:hypothetical protein
MGNYHHHQNPSAYKLDLNVICKLVCSSSTSRISDMPSIMPVNMS